MFFVYVRGFLRVIKFGNEEKRRYNVIRYLYSILGKFREYKILIFLFIIYYFV